MRFLPACVAIALAGLLFPQAVVAQLGYDLIHDEIDLTVVSQSTLGKTTSTLYTAQTTAVEDLEYTGVLLQGYSLSERLSVTFRTVEASGSPSEWIELYVVRSVTDGAFLAGYPGEDVRTARVEVLVETSDGRSPTVIVAGVFDKRRDDDEQSNPAVQLPSRRSQQITTVSPPELISRSEWNAGPFVGGSPVPLSTSNYTNMTFHHAAGFAATTYEQGIAQVKAIQDFHQNGRGWSDIGYQFVIDRGGRVYQGRPFLDSSTTLEEIPPLALGAHVGGFNTGNIGICLLGCYHPPEGANCEDQITPQALDSYVTMFAFLGEAYSIPIADASVKGHRDFSSTACPGDNNYVLLPTIREQAVQAQQFGNEVPIESVITQNAPNPFFGTTTIRYFLKDEGVVDLRVYDLAGRELRQLVNEFQEADRWNQVDFDASALPSGILFYRIRVEGFGGEVFNQTKPLIHVK